MRPLVNTRPARHRAVPDGSHDPRRAGGSGRAPARPEIQFLRAVAVGSVVLFHLWPHRLPGGYVGVDVFFVISGFLITGQILREADQRGHVRLWSFWARRARRLLPASLLVVLFASIGTVLFVSQQYWTQFSQEFAASAVYGQNWVLAFDSVDYFAQNSDIPSPVQHYWSLAVEEQFYVLWPVVVAALLLLARRANPRLCRRLLLAVVAVLSLASLAYSVVTTSGNGGFSYFDTFARAWEFGVGGLLTFVHWRQVPNRVVGTVLFWLGLAAIVGTCFGYDETTTFPGLTAAVPVLGAAALIAAGMPGTALVPDRLLTMGPARFLGDISYSLYLWHWPLIVLVEAQTTLTTRLKLAVLAASIVLAWASKRFVEDPVRHWRALTVRRPPVTFVLVAVCSLLASGVAGGMYVHMRHVLAHERRVIAAATSDPCLGAPTLADPACANGPASTQIVPSVATAAKDIPPEGCRTALVGSNVITCHYGSGSSGIHVALVGDSHAEEYVPALSLIAQARGWRLDTYLKGSCPFSTVVRDDTTAEQRASCVAWNKAALPLVTNGHYDYVFTARISGKGSVHGPDETADQAEIRGMVQTWNQLTAAGSRVVVFRDSPWRNTTSQFTCVEEHGASPQCAMPRQQALHPDLQVQAAARFPRSKVQVIDLTRFYCGEQTCPMVVGQVLLYKDNNHIGATYMKSLTRYVAADFDALIW